MKARVSFFKNMAKIGFVMVFFFAVKTFYEALPDHIYVEVGDEVSYDFQVPVTVVMKELEQETLQIEVNRDKMIRFASEDSGIEPDYYVTCKLFGILPVKDIAVSYVENEAVFASGMQVGIYAKTKGILVIGMGDVEDINGNKHCPAKNLIKAGDYIVSINGEVIEEKEDLIQAVNESGGDTKIIGIYRKDAFMEVAVTPLQTKEERYMLGVWVRDDMAGIGTLTFYRKDQSYGALGHPINDGDTGEILLLEEGSLYQTNIIGIKKGESGNPGELSGVIRYGNENELGVIDKNTEIGIYGILDGDLSKLQRGTYCEIGYKQEIEMREATILSAVSGEIREYDIVIESVSYSGAPINKGILFKVTDKELLELTGGIVQGMSGSPIVQNGKLVGAVTHVLVNDPTRGYGIFIENMLDVVE